MAYQPINNGESGLVVRNKLNSQFSELYGSFHAPVTVVDSSEIDFTLVGQQITASLVVASVTTSKLSASIIVSLGKADTAVQPADIADFETSAQLDARDTANRARANHTGTQLAATISDLTNAIQTDPVVAGALQESAIDLDLKTFVLPANTTITDYMKTVNGAIDAPTARSLLGVGAGGGDMLMAVYDPTPIGGDCFDMDNMVQGAAQLFLSALEYGKLGGIEDNADVTDAANVAAAGAVMWSGVDADLATLDLPPNTTITVFGKSLVGANDAAEARSLLGVAGGTTIDNSITYTVGAVGADFTTIDDAISSISEAPTAVGDPALTDANVPEKVITLDLIDAAVYTSTTGAIRFRNFEASLRITSSGGATLGQVGDNIYVYNNTKVQFDTITLAGGLYTYKDSQVLFYTGLTASALDVVVAGGTHVIAAAVTFKSLYISYFGRVWAGTAALTITSYIVCLDEGKLNVRNLTVTAAAAYKSGTVNGAVVAGYGCEIVVGEALSIAGGDAGADPLSNAIQVYPGGRVSTDSLTDTSTFANASNVPVGTLQADGSCIFNGAMPVTSQASAQDFAELTTTAGTGNLTFAGPVNLYGLAFADFLEDGVKYPYVMRDAYGNTNEYEIGWFEWDSTASEAIRTDFDVKFSSNSGNRVNWAAGTRIVTLRTDPRKMRAFNGFAATVFSHKKEGEGIILVGTAYSDMYCYLGIGTYVAPAAQPAWYSNAEVLDWSRLTTDPPGYYLRPVVDGNETTVQQALTPQVGFACDGFAHSGHALACLLQEFYDERVYTLWVSRASTAILDQANGWLHDPRSTGYGKATSSVINKLKTEWDLFIAAIQAEPGQANQTHADVIIFWTGQVDADNAVPSAAIGRHIKQICSDMFDDTVYDMGNPDYTKFIVVPFVRPQQRDVYPNFAAWFAAKQFIGDRCTVVEATDVEVFDTGVIRHLSGTGRDQFAQRFLFPAIVGGGLSSSVTEQAGYAQQDGSRLSSNIDLAGNPWKMSWQGETATLPTSTQFTMNVGRTKLRIGWLQLSPDFGDINAFLRHWRKGMLITVDDGSNDFTVRLLGPPLRDADDYYEWDIEDVSYNGPVSSPATLEIQVDQKLWMHSEPPFTAEAAGTNTSFDGYVKGDATLQNEVLWAKPVWGATSPGRIATLDDAHIAQMETAAILERSDTPVPFHRSFMSPVAGASGLFQFGPPDDSRGVLRFDILIRDQDTPNNMTYWKDLWVEYRKVGTATPVVMRDSGFGSGLRPFDDIGFGASVLSASGNGQRVWINFLSGISNTNGWACTMHGFWLPIYEV